MLCRECHVFGLIEPCQYLGAFSFLHSVQTHSFISIKEAGQEGSAQSPFSESFNGHSEINISFHQFF
ncbi:hypothetical protein Pint_28594 [Pistacia integerrima]|uniref:Uncharacterized protein n=1 Tax=Pistacia integerrima TaxID=434235 RepID=A0ACC0YQK2_9ROSI|nr:hypothetical protein Pint_28594 [Pistacia integerrima]